MVKRRFANDPLEVERLVREQQRIAVAQVDFYLAGTVFLDHRVDREAGILGELVDRVDHRAVVIHGGHRIGLPA